MTDQMKLWNLQDRLAYGGTEEQLHDLTYFSPFVVRVENFFGKYCIIFTDGKSVVYGIKTENKTKEVKPNE